jgi:uncharacterized protein (TIGR02996 family)
VPTPLPPVEQLHPGLRHTALGNVLRHASTEDSTAGLVARHVLAQPHDQPLDLMPFHVLRDHVLESDNHPLAARFNWERLPERLELDQTVRGETEKELGDAVLAATRDGRVHGIYPNVARAVRGDPVARSHYRIAAAVRARHPDATDDEIVDSVRRNHIRTMREHAHDNAAWNVYDPETERKEISSPDHGDHSTSPERFAAEYHDHADFHEKMHENPGEHTSTLAYSDWLEEQGQSHTAGVIRGAIGSGRATNEGEYHPQHGPQGVMEPGGFHVDHVPFLFTSGGETLGPHVVLSQRSASRPDRVFWWAHPAAEHEFPGHLRALAGEGAGTFAEHEHHLRPEPQKFAAMRAPAGGIVVRGLYYPGGQVIPGAQKFSAGDRKRRRKRAGRMWRETKIRLRYPVPQSDTSQ